MATLNIGCGRDPWGDVRLDLRRSQTGILNNPNIVASALCLPIKEAIITETRCFHVLEHIRDWQSLLIEIGRVSRRESRVQLRFPIDDGFKRDFLISWSRLDLSGMRNAYLTRKNQAHAWIVDPTIISTTLQRFDFQIKIGRNKRWLFFPAWILLPRWRSLVSPSLTSGRIRRFARKIRAYLPQFDYEWEVDCLRRIT